MTKNRTVPYREFLSVRCVRNKIAMRAYKPPVASALPCSSVHTPLHNIAKCPITLNGSRFKAARVDITLWIFPWQVVKKAPELTVDPAMDSI